jgi:hypothetical protein
MLGLVFVIAVIVGLAKSNFGLVVFGVPGALVFGFVAWTVSPSHVRSGREWRVLHHLDKIFDRLGIEWLRDPDRSGTPGRVSSDGDEEI